MISSRWLFRLRLSNLGTRDLGLHVSKSPFGLCVLSPKECSGAVSHIAIAPLRSKWAAGKAARAVFLRCSLLTYQLDMLVVTASPARTALKNSQLTGRGAMDICDTVH